MTEKEKQNKIIVVIDRANRANLIFDDRIALAMDLDAAIHTFNIDLDKLLSFDDFNFAHDICGIQKHINREAAPSGEWYKAPFRNCFLPRCSRSK